MRNLMKALVALVATALLFALPVEGLAREDNGRRGRVAAPVYSPNTGAGEANYTTITVDGVAVGTPKFGHVWRGDLVMTESDGTCRLLAEAAVRASAFADGLDRQSLEIRPDPDGTVLVVLPSAPRNSGERWAVSRHLSGSQRIPVRFLHKGKIIEKLPTEFVRAPIGTLSDLSKEAKELKEKGSKISLTKSYWLSAGELVPDAGVLVGLDSPLFEKEFSDEWGGAVQVSRDNQRGLIFAVDSVDRGLDTSVRQPDDPAVFNRSQYHRILFFLEKGRNLMSWPDRLSRFPTLPTSNNFELGTKFYVSAGEQYVLMMAYGGAVAPNFQHRPGGLAAMTPFHDQYGWAYEIVRMDYSFGAKLGVSGIPEPRWIFHVYDRILTSADVCGYIRNGK